MPLPLQAKLLRVLQEKEVERIGGTRPISIDVRVIACTNRDLTERIREGTFREDLFYRLHVVNLKLPSLRERMEDLPKLVSDLLEQLSESTGFSVKKIDPEVWQLLYAYSWPGNVRELRNVLERGLHLMEGDQLKPEHLLIPTTESKMNQGVRTLKESMELAEAEAIKRALAASGGNKLAAAKLLGISKSGFYQKLEKYHLLEKETKESKNVE